nr:hypothetical protein [Crucivirus sp.]
MSRYNYKRHGYSDDESDECNSVDRAGGVDRVDKSFVSALSSIFPQQAQGSVNAGQVSIGGGSNIGNENVVNKGNVSSSVSGIGSSVRSTSSVLSTIKEAKRKRDQRDTDGDCSSSKFVQLQLSVVEIYEIVQDIRGRLDDLDMLLEDLDTKMNKK